MNQLNPPSIPCNIAKAKQDLRRAHTRMIAECKAAYPVGCVVRVRLGSSLITGRVTGHAADWWNLDADLVAIRNEATGKRRRFFAGYHEAERIE